MKTSWLALNTDYQTIQGSAKRRMCKLHTSSHSSIADTTNYHSQSRDEVKRFYSTYPATAMSPRMALPGGATGRQIDTGLLPRTPLLHHIRRSSATGWYTFLCWPVSSTTGKEGIITARVWVLIQKNLLKQGPDIMLPTNAVLNPLLQ